MSKKLSADSRGSTVLEKPGVFESDSSRPLAFDVLLTVPTVEYDPFRSRNE